jgi:hypothetical protein
MELAEVEPRPNSTAHRPPGQMVEYGMGTPHGRDRLGKIVMEQRQHGRDGFLILPLNPGPGDGTLPSVYPADMVSDYQPPRWRYASQLGVWERTYAEIHRSEP